MNDAPAIAARQVADKLETLVRQRCRDGFFGDVTAKVEIQNGNIRRLLYTFSDSEKLVDTNAESDQ